MCALRSMPIGLKPIASTDLEIKTGYCKYLQFSVARATKSCVEEGCNAKKNLCSLLHNNDKTSKLTQVFCTECIFPIKIKYPTMKNSIDPLGRPYVMVIVEYFHEYSSILLSKNRTKQTHFQVKIVCTIGLTVGLAKWIIFNPFVL